MDAQSLIACWELGRRRHPLDRALLLYAAAEPDADPETLADRPLGERNAALLRFRQGLFGDALKSCVDCPECSERLEFSLSVETLLAQVESPTTPRSLVEIRGVRMRLPTTRDLASVAGEADETSAARRLLERLIGDAALPAGIDSREIAAALESADPHMDFSMELVCPACAHRWSAPFDVPAFLWEEVAARARKVLDEVHTLARAYGWSESEILSLGEVRRSAYLERALS